MLSHSSFAILPSHYRLRRGEDFQKFHIACCFQQLQTHRMIASHSKRFGKKNVVIWNSWTIDRILTECCSLTLLTKLPRKLHTAQPTLHGGGDKQASSTCKITGIHKSSLAPGRFSATNVHRHVSDGFNDTNEIGGDFHKSHVNYMALDFLCNFS